MMQFIFSLLLVAAGLYAPKPETAPTGPELMLKASSPAGAWSRQETRDGKEVTQILLFTEGFFSWTEYYAADGAFIMTKGGSWTGQGEGLTFHYEFHTAQPALVGTDDPLNLAVKKGKLTLQATGGSKTAWESLDAGITTPLTGAWLMAGRKNQDGEIQRRNTDGPRMTMKILTGNRFQWIAFNTETKEFFGTGGGPYTAENGAYTENLAVFSRDNSRVGAKLTFQFKIDGNDWHHSGLSSTGNPMYEVWARRD